MWRLTVLALLLLVACSSNDDGDPSDHVGGFGPGGNGIGGGAGGQLPADAAVGISVSDVRMNQGVGTLVVDDGQAVSSSAWSVPLIAGRPMLVRATWEVAPEFQPRLLRGVLTLVHAGGQTEELESLRMVSGPPDLSSLDTTFAWELSATQVTDAMSFSVQILEPEATGAAAQQVLAYRFPGEGEASLSLIADPMELHYVVVPAGNDCAAPPTLSPTDQLELEAYLFNLYPIQRLDVVYHDPVMVSGCDEGTILSLLSQLRASEALGPETYYQAIFGDGAMTGGGFAWVVGADAAADRVSYVGWWRNEPGNQWGGIDNAAHELGHNHGQSHTWEDASYEPMEGAALGGRDHWGFGLMSGNHPDWSQGDMHRLFEPTLGPDATGGQAFGDVMSYEFPYWISAYTYRKLAERVQAVSALTSSNASASNSEHAASMHGELRRDGSIEWSLLPGHPTSSSADPALPPTLAYRGRRMRRLPTFGKLSGEAELRGVIVVLPAGEDPAHYDHYRITLPDGPHELRPSQVDRIRRRGWRQSAAPKGLRSGWAARGSRPRPGSP